MINTEKHTVLQTEQLTIGYQSKKQQTVIASDINIAIEKGKFVALLGKNGI